jgi:hypothetical protein
MLNIFDRYESFLLRTAGGMFSLGLVTILIVCLTLAATIVASLIFRWLDRVASPR